MILDKLIAKLKKEPIYLLALALGAIAGAAAYVSRRPAAAPRSSSAVDELATDYDVSAPMSFGSPDPDLQQYLDPLRMVQADTIGQIGEMWSSFDERITEDAAGFTQQIGAVTGVTGNLQTQINSLKNEDLRQKSEDVRLNGRINTVSTVAENVASRMRTAELRIQSLSRLHGRNYAPPG